MFVAGPLTSHSSQQIRRFPGFSFSFGVGKRTEQKFQPSKNCQQFMNKRFDEVSFRSHADFSSKLYTVDLP